MDDELLRKIYAIYHFTGSLHKTADELGFAYAKVRKALITYGAYSTPFSNEVYFLRCKGYTVEEIAKELNTTTKRVSAWLPYEKNIYNYRTNHRMQYEVIIIVKGTNMRVLIL